MSNTASAHGDPPVRGSYRRTATTPAGSMVELCEGVVKQALYDLTDPYSQQARDDAEDFLLVRLRDTWWWEGLAGMDYDAVVTDAWRRIRSRGPVRQKSHGRRR